MNKFQFKTLKSALKEYDIIDILELPNDEIFPWSTEFTDIIYRVFFKFEETCHNVLITLPEEDNFDFEQIVLFFKDLLNEKAIKVKTCFDTNNLSLANQIDYLDLLFSNIDTIKMIREKENYDWVDFTEKLENDFFDMKIRDKSTYVEFFNQALDDYDSNIENFIKSFDAKEYSVLQQL